jgi:hypothetical protein
VSIANVTIGLLLTYANVAYDQSSLDVYLPMLLLVSFGKMTLLILLHLNDPTNNTLTILSCSAFSLLSTNVGKEMPISRTVIAVLNTTVVLLD